MATIKMDAVSKSTLLLMNLWTAFIGLLKAGLRAHAAVHFLRNWWRPVPGVQK
jgi:hypothetical protein